MRVAAVPSTPRIRDRRQAAAGFAPAGERRVNPGDRRRARIEARPWLDPGLAAHILGQIEPDQPAPGIAVAAYAPRLSPWLRPREVRYA
jgi:hypothetical protein